MNEVAQALARVATNYPCFHVFKSAPSCIFQMIMNEMTT